MSYFPALVAIDLGAESCRVSLLRWRGGEASITMARRFENGPQHHGAAGWHWNLDRICNELEAGLRTCAEWSPEGIAAIGVTGWAVDYVRLDPFGRPLTAPFCYRDARNQRAMAEVHAAVPAEKLYARTGVQIQPINTIYQLYADRSSGIPDSAPWVNLPEYILHWLGAPRVAEYTNATHTGLIDGDTRQWSGEIFAALSLDRAAAPEIVAPGTTLGPVRDDLRRLPAFAQTQLIAPACHDTASAIAGIPERRGDWAYISSGTWSLVGMPLTQSLRTQEAFSRGFTNLGAADGGTLFHRGLPGMWLLRQCMNTWDQERGWQFGDLIAEASRMPAPDRLLDLDDPALLPPGDMTARINEQRRRLGSPSLPSGCDAAPHYASLIFRSLAARYGTLIAEIAEMTGEKPHHIAVVGGGSQNEYLNALTAEATGLPVQRCSAESSTLGNFAIQWARIEQSSGTLQPQSVAEKVSALAAVQVA
ncbi:MAG TPA: FGGY family carbohydrate kinase [Acidobacteriaceae bacterium]|nr:FGGY family carbohydrate kinase [Acidobacteriaceae bacterium]